ncbi:MAG: T3SS (YopN, CesT) and YbjN peptide-binding chaperone 1 [Actinomycetota bacterium]
MATEPKGEGADEEEHPKPRPTGEPDGVAKLRELVETQLGKMFDRYLVNEQGNYVLGLDTARVFVVPTWLEDEQTVVRIFAITNLDVPVTADLTSYLLAQNLEFVLGAFALDVDHGAVWFNHNLLGAHMTPEEFEASLAAVAQTAERFDNEIKDRFGGRLYVEAPGAAVPPPPSPGYL